MRLTHIGDKEEQNVGVEVTFVLIFMRAPHFEKLGEVVNHEDEHENTVEEYSCYSTLSFDPAPSYY